MHCRVPHAIECGLDRMLPQPTHCHRGHHGRTARLLGIDGTVTAPREREERGRWCRLIGVLTTWQVYNYWADE